MAASELSVRAALSYLGGGEKGKEQRTHFARWTSSVTYWEMVG